MKLTSAIALLALLVAVAVAIPLADSDNALDAELDLDNSSEQAVDDDSTPVFVTPAPTGTPKAPPAPSCAPGSFLNPNKECTKCPALTYEKDKNCLACPAGSDSAAGATSCTQCPAGSYRDAGYNGQGSIGGCRKCFTGSIAATAGSASCSSCAKGTYSPGEGGTVCIACGIKTYTQGIGASKCTVCPYEGDGMRCCSRKKWNAQTQKCN